MTKEQKIEQEKKLIEEWLAKGNKPEVHTRDFNDEDYQLGYVKSGHKNIDSSVGSDK